MFFSTARTTRSAFAPARTVRRGTVNLPWRCTNVGATVKCSGDLQSSPSTAPAGSMTATCQKIRRAPPLDAATRAALETEPNPSSEAVERFLEVPRRVSPLPS